MCAPRSKCKEPTDLHLVVLLLSHDRVPRASPLPAEDSFPGAAGPPSGPAAARWDVVQCAVFVEPAVREVLVFPPAAVPECSAYRELSPVDCYEGARVRV